MSDEKIKEIERPKIPEPTKEEFRPQKEGRSTFDKVLEQSRLLQQSPRQNQPTVSKGEGHEGRVARQQEQGEKGRDRQSDDKEKERGKEKSREDRNSGTTVDQRVGAKGQMKGSADKGGGGKGRGFGQSSQKKVDTMLRKGALSKGAEAALEGSQFASRLKAHMKASQLSKEFIERLVGQIVKFAKLGKNRQGEEEIHIDLRERIFRGLQLRIAMKHGRVDIQFNTSNAEVRELFTNSSDAIKKELKAKGVSVGNIKVT